MKRAKEDAADRLVNAVLAAVRRYKAEKDAPTKPVQHSFIHEDDQRGDWYGHLPHCRNEQVCVARFLAEQKGKTA